MAKQDNDKHFLVFGTPCQMAGLSGLLQELDLRNQFVLVELFCYGVPSNLLWQGYVQKMEKKFGRISHVNFRNKTAKWHTTSMEIVGGGGNKYIRTSMKDLFYQMFFSSQCLMEHCYSCKWRKQLSMSDIRLGDYWGERYADDEYGVSAVIILSECGNQLLKRTGGLSLIEEAAVMEILVGQRSEDYEAPLCRGRILQILRTTGSIQAAFTCYTKSLDLETRFRVLVMPYLPSSLLKILKIISKMRYRHGKC
jgi:coenzyme F420-reducing hydrogenase beta subunit